MLERMYRKGNPRALLVGLHTGVAVMENDMEIPQNSIEIQQKTKNRYIIQPINSSYGYLSKENENTNSERHIYVLLYSLQHYLQWSIDGSNVGVHR